MSRIIQSLLDTDLYKLTMSCAYFLKYPNAEGTFKFNDRGMEEYDESFKEMLLEAFRDMSTLRLSDAEADYLASLNIFPSHYIEWLKTFGFDFLNRATVDIDADKHLHIEVTDKMHKVTLYETPILAIVSECRNRYLGVGIDIDACISILSGKVAFAKEHKLYFSEFGTRRRASYELHDAIVRYLSQHCRDYCVGTSNIFLAMKYGMKPNGTQAHEFFMFHSGINGFKLANETALDAWRDVYKGKLAIALMDTFTTKSFLHTLTLEQAKSFDGFRQDSGDEIEVGEALIAKLQELGIDPATKMIVFSNALDFPKYNAVAAHFKGRIKVSSGIGTNLTCDLGIDGYKPANIVMKLNRCRKSSNDFWEDVIKISDDVGKHMGEDGLFEIASKELHLNEIRMI